MTDADLDRNEPYEIRLICRYCKRSFDPEPDGIERFTFNEDVEIDGKPYRRFYHVCATCQAIHD